jgi:FMN phosphatase YigB (HAD superfamily)
VKPPRILLFDVFGTLVDWRSSLIDIAEATATRSKVQADWAGLSTTDVTHISPRWTRSGAVPRGAISIPSSAKR